VTRVVGVPCAFFSARSQGTPSCSENLQARHTHLHNVEFYVMAEIDELDNGDRQSA
jgi:hypothetical protein